MAKDRKKLVHIHSNIPDKQPTPQALEPGEIAVNNSTGNEFISLKNSDDKVVRISTDKTLVDWMEKKEVMPYKGTVENVHLDTNRSNIELKFNQVVASQTKKSEVVNGAKDIDGELVNPTTDGGLTDGAGFAIDMSLYAMNGANPSFSSITVTHQSDLSGTTNITDGAGGKVLNIKTETVNATDKNWNETITAKTSTVGTADTTVTSAKTDITTATTTIGTSDFTGTTVNNNIDNLNETVGTAVTTITSAKTDVDTATTNVTAATTTIDTAVTKVISAKTDVTSATTTVGTSDFTGTTVTNNIGDLTNTINTATTTVGTADTTVTSAKTDVNTAATTVGTADTTVTSANTNITTSNLTGTTFTNNISGLTNTIGISNSTVTATTYSGQTLSITEDSTNIESCGHYHLKTNDYKVEQCTSGGTVSLEFDDLTLSGKTLTVDESVKIDVDTPTFDLSGTTLNIKENDTTIDSCGKVTVKSDDVLVSACTTDGKVEVDTKDVTINADANINENAANVNIAASNNADIKGVNNLKLSGASTSISAVTLTESAKTVNITGTTAINEKGGEVHVSADTTAEISAGTKVDITGDTSVNVKGENFTLSGTNASVTGTNLTVSETNTDVTSCGRISANTNALTVKECDAPAASTAEVGFKTITVSGDTLNVTEKVISSTSDDILVTNKVMNVTNSESTTITTPSTTLSGSTLKITEDTKIEVDTPTSSLKGKDLTIVETGTTAITAKTATVNGETLDVTETTSIDVKTPATTLSGATLNITETSSTTVNTPTATLNGANLVVNETTKVDVKTPTTTLSGTNLTVTETNTTVNSCGKVDINTDALTVKQCDENGNLVVEYDNITIKTDGIELESCDKYAVTSNDISLKECANGGKFEINSTTGKVIGKTTLDISGNTINEKGATINISGGTTTNISGNTNLNLVGTNVNVSGTTKISGNTTVGGDTTLNKTLKVSGDTTVKGNTNISGNTVVGGTMKVSGTTTLKDTVTLISGLDKNITINHGAYGVTGSPFNGSDNMSISIPSGSTEVNRTATSGSISSGTTSGVGKHNNMTSNVRTDITATTVENALQEIRQRSIVTLEKKGQNEISDNGILASYTVWQDGVSRGTIDIPKDFILEDAKVVQGNVNGSSFTANTTGKKYIELTFNVKGGSESGNQTKLYVDASGLVNDFAGTSTNSSITIAENASDNNEGVMTWNFITDGTKIMTSGTSEHYSANTSITNALKAIDDAKLDIADTRTLTIASGTPSSSITFNPAGSASTIAYTASDVAHLNRGTLSWSYGSVTGASNASYDPGSGTVNTTRSTSFVIPKALKDLNNDLSNLTFNTGTTSVAGSPYNGSAAKTITVASDVNHLYRNNLTFAYGTPSTGVTSYDPGAGTVNGTGRTTTVTIPTAVSHLSRGTLTVTNGAYSGGTYDATGNVTVKVPSSLSHLSEWGTDCLSINKDVCITGKISASNGFYTSSDRNLKENIDTVGGSIVRRAGGLSIRSFNYKADETKRTVYGVIAQDLEEAGFNELVHIDDDGVRSVDYTGLLMLKIANLEYQYKKVFAELEKLKESLKGDSDNKE